MILQELIRNYIAYREVIKPILASFKESLIAGYSKESFILSSSLFSNANYKAKPVMGGGEEFGWDISDEEDSRTLSHMSGTRTITKHKRVVMNDFDLFAEAKAYISSGLSGKETYIVLAHDGVIENIVEIGKTSYQEVVLGIIHMFPGVSKTISLTTGFESKQINTFLITETHEKREYLGEFSLTHEETPLLYQLRGGEYHDIS